VIVSAKPGVTGDLDIGSLNIIVCAYVYWRHIDERGQAINSQYGTSFLQHSTSNDGAEGFKADATGGSSNGTLGFL
jgi:hypothetical protein